MDYFNGIYKTYRITIYYESDQGPLPLGQAISNMTETSHSIITNRILNIEAEQQVLLDDGTYVNTESEMSRIEIKNRNSEIRLFQREYTTYNQQNPKAISQPPSLTQRFDPDIQLVSDKLLEPVPDSNYSSLLSNKLRHITKDNIKQTSILEYLR